jgi:hypothetical protein
MNVAEDRMRHRGRAMASRSRPPEIATDAAPEQSADATADLLLPLLMRVGAHRPLSTTSIND